MRFRAALGRPATSAGRQRESADEDDPPACGKERSLLRRHPWVFESSIERGKADPGETVRVEAHDGSFLAWAAFSPASKIRLRAWSFDEAERIDAAFFAAPGRARGRVARAAARSPSDGVRLVHGEADGLPGLVVDRYADTLMRAVPVGRHRALEGGARRRAAAVERRHAPLRALATPACARSKACEPAPAGCAASGDHRGDDPRARLAADGRRRRRATRPATTSTSATTARRFADAVRQLRLPARAELLRLHRRLQRGRTGRRRRARDQRRFVGAGAGARRRRMSR